MGTFDFSYWVPVSFSGPAASPIDNFKQVALGYYDSDKDSGEYQRIWALNTWNEIFRRDPFAPVAEGGWQRVAGELVQVSVGPQAIALPDPAGGIADRQFPMASIWGVNQAGAVYRRVVDSTDNSWVLVPGPPGTSTAMAEIAVGAHSTWGLARDGALFEWGGSGQSNEWRFSGTQFKLRSIAVEHETVWAVTTFGRPGRIRKPAYSCELVGGELVQIAASSKGVCGINAAGEVFFWEGGEDVGDHWARIPSTVDYGGTPSQRGVVAFTGVAIGTPGGNLAADPPRLFAIDVGGRLWQLAGGNLN